MELSQTEVLKNIQGVEKRTDVHSNDIHLDLLVEKQMSPIVKKWRRMGGKGKIKEIH